MHPYRIVSIAAAVGWQRAYDFAHDPGNFPRWAEGLAAGIERDGDHWVAQSPMGEVRVEMAADNGFGVMDHVVTLPSGDAVHNAFRVSPNGDGCVLAFVVLRTDGMDDAAFDRDVAHVELDLGALKKLLEAEAG